MQTPDSRHPIIDARRLWAGAGATAVVAGLVGLVAMMVVDVGFDVTPVQPVWLIGDGSHWSLYTRFAFTGVVAALLAAGLLHLLLLAAPKPLVFFGWIVTLVTIAAGVAPFGIDANLSQQIATAAIAASLGIVIGTALTAVAGRTVS